MRGKHSDVRITHHWQNAACVIDIEALETLDEIVALFPGGQLTTGTPGAPDIRVSQLGPDITVTPGDPEPYTRSCDAVSAVEHAVTMHFLTGDPHHTHLHASGALTEAGAILAMGRSGSGKSTLAFTWSNMGVPILGDDVVLLDDNSLAHTFPRLLKVDKERFRASGKLPRNTLAWDPEADDVWVDPQPLGGWAQGGTPITVITEVAYKPGGDLRIEAITGGEGLRVLLNSVHQTGVDRGDSIDRLIGLTEKCPIYRVEFGDAGQAAKALLGMATDVHAR